MMVELYSRDQMSKKIIFMGTPDYATVIFEELIKSSYDVVALFTQPDKKQGRKQVLTPPHIKQYCIDNNIELPIFQPDTLKSEEIAQEIENFNADFIVVAAYGQILPKRILDIAPCINLHASLLPLYRGASPIQSSILNNDQFSGVTSMLMEEGLDSGDVLGLQYVEVTKEMDVAQLFNALSIAAAKLTINTLDNFDHIKSSKQNESKVSHCGKIKKEDGQISLEDAFDVYQTFKAYKYWPGVFLESGLKIKECEIHEINSSNNVSEIIEITKDFIIVACKKGTLKITKIQPPSKKEMLAVDYIRGQRLEIGNCLS
jgi:methionyl-tRNA formyltransferase